MKKCIIMILVLLIVTCFFSNTVFADNGTVDSVIEDMKKIGEVDMSNSKMGKVINAIVKLIQVAGSGISVVVVTMLGIKYMMASANEKADIKKQAVPIVIGCVLLFAGANIAGIIADLAISLGD